MSYVTLLQGVLRKWCVRDELTIFGKKRHFSSYSDTPVLLKSMRTLRKRSNCSVGDHKKITTSSKCTRADRHLIAEIVTSIVGWNDSKALRCPNAICIEQYSPRCNVKAVLLKSCLSNLTCQLLVIWSTFTQTVSFFMESIHLSIRDMESISIFVSVMDL